MDDSVLRAVPSLCNLQGQQFRFRRPRAKFILRTRLAPKSQTWD